VKIHLGKVVDAATCGLETPVVTLNRKETNRPTKGDEAWRPQNQVPYQALRRP